MKKRILYVALALLVLIVPSLEPVLRDDMMIGAFALFSHILLLIGVTILCSHLRLKKWFLLERAIENTYSFYIIVSYLPLIYLFGTGNTPDLQFILDHGFSSVVTAVNSLGWPSFILLLTLLIGLFFFVSTLLKYYMKTIIKRKKGTRLLADWRIALITSIIIALLLFNLGPLTGPVAGISTEFIFKNKQRGMLFSDFEEKANIEFITDSKNNIFILQLESVNALDFIINFTTAAGEHYEGVFMPNLYNISKKGILFPGFYANSIQTIRAHENILCGIYDNFRDPYSYRLDELDFKCLPQLLKENYYSTYYFSGGSLAFANTEPFMEKIGFQEVLHEEFLNLSVPMGDWGVHDNLVYPKMFDYLQKRHIKKEKLFVFISVLSHHYPFPAHPQFESIYYFKPRQKYYNDYLNSLLVQDHFLQIFMSEYNKKYANNSYLFILGDHPFPVGHRGNYWNEEEAFEENFLTVLSVIPPAGKDFLRGEVINNKYSHSDIMPTIMSLLSNEYHQNSFSFTLNESHHGYADKYENCHVMIQPYDEGFFVVNDKNQKYVYSFKKKTTSHFDLNDDPNEQYPTVSTDVQFSEFLFKHLCWRYKKEFILKKLFAHRGLSSKYPENTILSIGKAGEAGFGQVEIDITTLSDGNIVVFHDPVFERKSDGKGKVCQATTDKMSHYKVRFPNGTASDQHIPLLETVFSHFGSNFSYHLDIKDFGCLPLTFTEDLVNLIERYGLTEYVYVESQDIRQLVRINKINPKLKLIYWNENPAFFLNSTLLKEVRKQGITSLDFNYDNLNSDLVKSLKEIGFKIHVYTVNDKEKITRLLYNNVDFVMTDIDLSTGT